MRKNQKNSFRVDPESGLIEPALLCLSPNEDARPEGCEPELIVIHGISLPPGSFGGPEIEQLFTNRLDWDAHPYFQEIRGMQVSSHLLIRRDGTVMQFVPFHRRAWHAGDSRFRGRTRCNDFSLGIELEGTDEDRYTDAQYQQLAAVDPCNLRRIPCDVESKHCRPLRHIAGKKVGSRSCFRLAALV